MERACESCAGEDTDLVAVHRLYLDLSPDGEPFAPVAASVDPPVASRVEETELWCFACRSLYPHELAETD